MKSSTETRRRGEYARRLKRAAKIVPALTEVLDDPAPTVRYWAISALTWTKAIHLVPRLEEIALTDHAEAPEPDFSPPDYMPPKVSEIAAEVAERIRQNVEEAAQPGVWLCRFRGFRFVPSKQPSKFFSIYNSATIQCNRGRENIGCVH